MIEAVLLIAVAAVIASSLAAGFRTRVRLATGLAGASYPGPGGSLPVGLAGRVQAAGVSWRCLARMLLRPSSGVIMLASWLMLAETALTLAAPWPLKVIIDHGLGQRPLAAWLRPLDSLRPVPLAAAAAAAGVVLLAAAALLGYLVTYMMAAVSEQAYRDLQYWSWTTCCASRLAGRSAIRWAS